MAKGKISQLRKKYVDNFYFRNIDDGKYGVARVTKVQYFGNKYVIFYSAVYVDEHGKGTIISSIDDYMSVETFKSIFKKRCNKKWVEGLLEHLIDRVKNIGDGLIDI